MYPITLKELNRLMLSDVKTVGIFTNVLVKVPKFDRLNYIKIGKTSLSNGKIVKNINYPYYQNGILLKNTDNSRVVLNRFFYNITEADANKIIFGNLAVREKYVNGSWYTYFDFVKRPSDKAGLVLKISNNGEIGESVNIKNSDWRLVFERYIKKPKPELING